VPAAALSPAAAPAAAARQALKDRMLAPRVQWQTYSNPTMGAHVRMPQAVALDATLADLATNATLGDIIVFRQASPAITFVGAHSYNGSDFTQVQLDAWGGRACTIVLRTTTSADGADLAFLATSNGTGCATLALLVRPEMLWGRAGNFSRDASGALRAATPGFPDTLAWPLGAAPVPFPKAGALDWALPLGGGAAGFTTGAAPRAVADVAADIDAASARQDAALQKWDARGLTSVYVPQASCIAWNTIYTPYEGVVTPVSRGWDFGAGYVIFDWDSEHRRVIDAAPDRCARDRDPYNPKSPTRPARPRPRLVLGLHGFCRGGVARHCLLEPNSNRARAHAGRLRSEFRLILPRVLRPHGAADRGARDAADLQKVGRGARGLARRHGARRAARMG
jgi:hypothetical protein